MMPMSQRKTNGFFLCFHMVLTNGFFYFIYFILICLQVPVDL